MGFWRPVVRERLLMLIRLANSSRCYVRYPAASRPNAPAFSARVPTLTNSASLSLPKQEDLKWLTTTSRNLRRTGRTAFPSIRDQARGAWGLSLLASLLYSSYFTPSSGALASRLNKTQAPSRPLLKRHLRQQNNDHHSRLNLRGRGAIPAPKAVRALNLPLHFELGGIAASATEVRPC